MGCLFMLPFAVLVMALAFYMSVLVSIFTLFASAMFAILSASMAIVGSIITGILVAFFMFFLM